MYASRVLLVETTPRSSGRLQTTDWFFLGPRNATPAANSRNRKLCLGRRTRNEKKSKSVYHRGKRGFSPAAAAAAAAAVLHVY